MKVRRYSLGGGRELRTTRTKGLVFIALHDLDRCASGPLGIPEDHFATFWTAVTELADELASRQRADSKTNGAKP